MVRWAISQSVGAGEQHSKRARRRPLQADQALGERGGKETDRNAGAHNPVSESVRLGAGCLVNDVQTRTGGQIRPEFPYCRVKAWARLQSGPRSAELTIQSRRASGLVRVAWSTTYRLAPAAR